MPKLLNLVRGALQKNMFSGVHLFQSNVLRSCYHVETVDSIKNNDFVSKVPISGHVESHVC